MIAQDARDQLEARLAEQTNAFSQMPSPELKIGGELYPFPPIDVRLCPLGCHIVAAHRWERRCDRCHQGIKSGAVGLHHAFGGSRTRCMVGKHSWEHHCGEPMPPTEHVEDIDTDEINNQLDQLLAEASDGDELEGAIYELGWQLVKKAVVALKRQVDRERQDAQKQVWRGLFNQLDHALRQVHQGAPPEDVITGDDLEPGVDVEDGELLAWDFDPLDPDGGPLVVRPWEFELVGAAEVARLAGLSELTVRTYVKRDYIARPTRVAGSDALVWHRADVDSWLFLRAQRGEII
jgi:predicted DNA-binding transcriptional regulator AlpA